MIDSPQIFYGTHARSESESANPSLWQGLVGAIMPCVLGPTDWFDVVSPVAIPTRTGTKATPTYLISPAGWAWSTVGETLTFPTSSGQGNKWKVSPPMTFAAMFRRTTAFTTYLLVTDSRAVAFPPSSGVLRGIMFIADPTGFFVAACDGTQAAIALNGLVGSAGSLSDSSWDSVIVTVSGEPITSSNVVIYENGVPVTVSDNGVSMTALHVNAANMIVNGTRATLDTGAADIAGMALWKRVLSYDEIQALTADIAAPLRPRRFRGGKRPRRLVSIDGVVYAV